MNSVPWKLETPQLIEEFTDVIEQTANLRTRVLAEAQIPYSLYLLHSALRFFKFVTKMLGKISIQLVHS